MTLLDDTSPLIVGATCDVIGSIGRLNPVPIDDSNKSSLIKKLLSISFNSSIISKVKLSKIRLLVILFIYILLG